MNQEKRRHEGALKAFKSRRYPSIELAYVPMLPIISADEPARPLEGREIIENCLAGPMPDEAQWRQVADLLPGAALALVWSDGSMIALEHPGSAFMPMDIVFDAYGLARTCLEVGHSPGAAKGIEAILAGRCPGVNVLPHKSRLQ